MKKKGILFVISGPSGAGKGTVLKEVFKQVDNLIYSVSATTRAPRNQEKEGVNYFFMSEEEFDGMIARGELLEHVEKFGNKYGTIKSRIEKALGEGKDIVLEIETAGAEQIRKKEPDAVFIFLTPSTIEEIVRRLNERNTESAAGQQRRAEIGREELKCAYGYDYLVINDGLDCAVRQLAAIIEAERLKVCSNKEIIRQIINN